MRLHHIALRTRDLDRLRAFFVDVLGLRPVPRPGGDGPAAWLAAGDVVLMLERASPGEPQVPAGSLELVAFAVDDKEAWRARLGAAGVPVEAETAHTLYFRDPDGRRLAVSAHPLR